jgi:hypothetical protein
VEFQPNQLETCDCGYPPAVGGLIEPSASRRMVVKPQ